MQVHKHPHRAMHEKKWFEYLLEFLMIFLAVFLGFFAENIRERSTDKERLVRQMRTMVGNLKFDTTRFGRNLRLNLAVCKGLDSFRLQIDEAIAGKVDANKLYYYQWKYGRLWWNPIPNVSAMLQLQNSGMLRLVKDDSLVFYMGDYYERRLTTLDRSRAALTKSTDELLETYKMFFDLHGFEELVERDTVFTSPTPNLQNYYAGILKRNPALALFSTDPKDLRHLYTDLTSYELRIHTLDSFTRLCHDGADSLMKRIQIEYNIK